VFSKRSNLPGTGSIWIYRIDGAGGRMDSDENDVSVEDRLVGRVDELKRLRGFLASAVSGGAACLVTVDPGVGKSALLAAATAEAAERLGMRVLRAEGVDFEAAVSFSGGHDQGQRRRHLTAHGADPSRVVRDRGHRS
jgi:hypothetical protein